MYIFFLFFCIVILACIIWKMSSRPIPCPAYLSWLLEMDNPFTRTNQTGAIIENLNLALGMNVLDVGCGPGRLTIPIATKIGSEGSVTALDVQSGMLDRVREKATKAHLSNIRYLQAKIGEDQLKINEYDRGLLITVLGEITDREKAVREIYNSLKPGGILLVTETIFDPHFQRKSTVAELAKKVGFELKSTGGNRFSFTMILEKPSK